MKITADCFLLFTWVKMLTSESAADTFYSTFIGPRESPVFVVGCTRFLTFTLLLLANDKNDYCRLLAWSDSETTHDRCYSWNSHFVLHVTLFRHFCNKGFLCMYNTETWLPFFCYIYIYTTNVESFERVGAFTLKQRRKS